jgi:hypothetical protein
MEDQYHEVGIANWLRVGKCPFQDWLSHGQY